MKRTATLFFGFSLTIASAACGGTAEPTRMSVRDSAGVQIVENFGGDFLSTVITISDEPVLRLSRDGDENYEFFGAFGGLRLDDGTYVVSNLGDRSIRYFSPTGEWIGSFGRRGRGPCEWANPSRVFRLGPDTLAVADVLRFVVFTVGGECISTRDVGRTAARGLRNISGRLDDGSLFASESSLLGSLARTGISRDSIWWLRLDEDLEPVNEFGPLPGFARYGPDESSWPRYTPLFWTYTRLRVANGGIAVADNRHYQIDFLSAEGALRRSVRRETGPRTLTDNDVARAREILLDRDLDPELGRERRVQLEIPAGVTELPAMQDFLVDLDGFLWVNRYERPGDEDGAWDVFEPTGRYAGKVYLEPDIMVLEIGFDYLLGVVRDEFDVEHPVVYSILRQEEN